MNREIFIGNFKDVNLSYSGNPDRDGYLLGYDFVLFKIENLNVNIYLKRYEKLKEHDDFKNVLLLQDLSELKNFTMGLYFANSTNEDIRNDIKISLDKQLERGINIGKSEKQKEIKKVLGIYEGR